MDLEPLLRPLPGAGLCGEDLSFSTEFDRIQEARRFDDPLLNQGEWRAELKEADWRAVVADCGELLAHRSKDLRLAVWLAEGLAKEGGCGGLADGYTLLTELCDRYWDGIHPLPDEDGQALRVGTLSWLMAQSPRIICELPITDSELGVYSSADLDAVRRLARALERAPLEAESLTRDARITQAAFDAAREATLPDFYHEGARAARQALAALERLEEVLGRRLGAEAPAFRPAREALHAAIEVFERFVPADPAASPAPRSAPPPPSPSPKVAGGSPELPLRAIPAPAEGFETRAQALLQLRRVGAYFRHAEPHSPVGYLALKAADWGEMSLAEWLRAVVRDGSTLAQLEDVLGVHRPTVPGADDFDS